MSINSGTIQPPPTGGGGGGDATAANQTTQIAIEASMEQATLNTNLALRDANGLSVFRDNSNNDSVFKDNNNNDSVFKTGTVQQSIPKLSHCTNGSTKCVSFTDTAANSLAAQIESLLQTSPIAILSISYSNYLTTFSAIVAYNPIL